MKEKAGALSDEAITLSAEVRDFVEALGGLSDDKSFRTYAVDLPAVLKIGDRSVDVRVIKLSAGVVVFSGEIAAALGSKLAFTIAGVDRELSGRLVGREAGGIMLQLPLSHAHLTYMEEVIAKLVKEAA